MKINKILLSALTVLLIGAAVAGCGGGGDGKETSDSHTAGTDTAAETENADELKPVEGDSFVLNTKSASLTLNVTEKGVSIASLKTSGGTEYITEPCALMLPDTEDVYDYSGAYEFVGERGSEGYAFKYLSGRTEYMAFVVSNKDYGGPFEVFGILKNKSASNIGVMSGRYFDLDVKFAAAPTSYVFRKESGEAEGWTIYNGTRYEGSGIYTKVLSDKASASAEYSTNQDWNCGGDISMMYLDAGTNGMYIAHEWSSGSINARGMSNNGVGIDVRLGQGSFETKLSPEQTMLYPSVYVGAYDGDLDIGSNLYKRWFFNCKAPENLSQNPMEPFVQMDMQIGNDVSDYGIQAIKWDYGWWSNKSVGSWKNEEGSIYVKDPNYLNVIGAGPTTSIDKVMSRLKKFVNNTRDIAEKKGNYPVSMTVYFLLKDTQIFNDPDVPTSVGKYAHPEWFSDRIVTTCPSADLGNEECVAFYQKYMENFFSTFGIQTWRSDFEPICRSSDKSNRHYANGSDVQYWCTVGFGELVDYLIENVEGFRYESCSSGGSMKDIFTMTKATVINTEDTADYMSAHMAFYDSSYCIHPAQLQLPVNALTYIPGSQYYTGTADYMYGLRCQLTGAPMLSNWAGTNYMYKETDAWKTVIAVDYNTKMKPLIREGDLYHVLGRPDGVNWDGLEYILPDGEKGMLMVWKPEGAEDSKTVVLRGLDENATYKVEFTDHTDANCSVSGKELMEKGITLTFTGGVASDVIYLTKI